MVYKIKKQGIRWVMLPLLFMLLFSACSEETNSKKETFYIELVNFNDSLRNIIAGNSFGKVVFYKENRMQILSKNFMTEEYPVMHYLDGIDALGTQVTPGVKKIRVEFVGEYSADSIRYSLQKYKYADNKWVKLSDMGILKAVTTYKMAKHFSGKEFGKQIINAVAEYTFQ
ncbi:MAG TPA: hypothetical protein PLZ45_01900 [Ferruginibacter sp.]|nr:hypothetical protein [Chitinophagaceae bacterium]HRI23393.1 hypothetical protein [Ferruginibacter sp.]